MSDLLLTMRDIVRETLALSCLLVFMLTALVVLDALVQLGDASRFSEECHDWFTPSVEWQEHCRVRKVSQPGNKVRTMHQ